MYSMYKHKQKKGKKDSENDKGGFSLLPIIVGVAVGVVTGGIGLGLLAGGATALLTSGSDSSSGQQTAQTTGTTQGTAGGTNSPCGAVQNQVIQYQSEYEASAQSLDQAQTDLNTSKTEPVSQDNSVYGYNMTQNASSVTCQQPIPLQTCSYSISSNQAQCSDIISKCTDLVNLINTTNTAACQAEQEAQQVLLQRSGASSTAGVDASNAAAYQAALDSSQPGEFTVSVSPATVSAGSYFVILASTEATDISTYSIGMLDSTGTYLGDLVTAAAMPTSTPNVPATVQYKLLAPAAMQPGAYTVKVFSTSNSSESGLASLVITPASATSTSNGSTALSITLNPATIYQGDQVTVSGMIESPTTQSYSIIGLKNGVSIGNLVTDTPVTSATRPYPFTNTFQTPSTIPVGTYTIEAIDDGDQTQIAPASLTVLDASTKGAATSNVGGDTSGTGSAVSVNSGTASYGSACLDLTANLKLGMRDSKANNDAVTSLQGFLETRGYFNQQPTGYFGQVTMASVKNFQRVNGISTTGLVGPLTRKAIQGMTCSDNASATATAAPQCPAGYVCAPGISTTATATTK